MNKFLSVLFLCLIAVGALCMPMVSEAADPSKSGADGTVTQSGADGTVTQSGADGTVTLHFGNPTKYKTIICLLFALFKVFMNVFAVIAGLYILYAGFRFVSAQGKPDKLKAARQNFWYVLIGTLLILGAWGVVVLTINTVNEVLDEDIAWIPSNSVCNAK